MPAHTWDRERLSAETIDLLCADGTAIREHLITAVVPFENAPELFANLAARRGHELQAVLAFDPSMAEPRPAAALWLKQCPYCNHATSGYGPVEVSPASSRLAMARHAVQLRLHRG